MNTFSFVMEYKGGTYVSQMVSNSNDMHQVCKDWAETLDTKGIGHMGKKIKKLLVYQIQAEDNKPVLLVGLVNVWFIHLMIKGKGVYINIIPTVLSSFY